MTPDEFIRKWKASTLTERSAAQSHFLDLCTLLNEATPTDSDQVGNSYTFEKGATKTTGGKGWADVWKRGCFAWEYKGKHKDLTAAFAQLQQYGPVLENPPLLVVSDMERIEVHTNWTNTVAVVHCIDIDELRDAGRRDILKWVFSDPEKLKPGRTRRELTEDVAREFAQLAWKLQSRGHDPQAVAHFVNRLVFCMFAEDVALLPNNIFKKMLRYTLSRPEAFSLEAQKLFSAMLAGGSLNYEQIPWFNGGLFDTDDVLPLEKDDIKQVLTAAEQDWGQIEPAILGTLFERGLDPDKRGQLGAHYTDAATIMRLIEPVITMPLTREWEAVRTEAQDRIAGGKPGSRTRARNEAERLCISYLERLRRFRVLDPACGSGNFLYLALITLKTIEHRVNLDIEAMGFTRQFPTVGPEAVQGIEINPYAAELARVSVWIGEIQWMRRSGFAVSSNPILKPLDTIECRDALLDNASPAPWPFADAIVGNPPFLGDRKIAPVLGQAYADRLRNAYNGRVPGGADLVCYWFEQAQTRFASSSALRVGFVSTNSIRSGLNRAVLDSITKDLAIYNAWSDERWVVEGAAVRVSIVCFSQKNDRITCELDGLDVAVINADLTATLDLTTAKRLASNRRAAFQGTISYGAFEIPGDEARALLQLPTNPNGRPNSDVVRPWTNGQDIAKRPQDYWIVFFPDSMTEEQAALYEAPYEIVRLRVKPYRLTKPNIELNKHWWRLWRSRSDLFAATKSLKRQIVTPRVSKHRLFVWLSTSVVADSATVVIARDDDTTFGILHSRFHELWTLRMCSWLGVGNDPRYTPGSVFDTFPFPEGLTLNVTADDYADDPRASEIATAAQTLDSQRKAWLNPPEWVRPVQEVVVGLPERLVPVDAVATANLNKRTLTGLYNQRPAWLGNAHRALDAAVAAAYGWPADLSDNDVLTRLLALNLARAAKEQK